MLQNNQKSQHVGKHAQLEQILQAAYHAFYKENDYGKAAALAKELLHQTDGIGSFLLYGDWRKQAKFLQENILRKMASQRFKVAASPQLEGAPQRWQGQAGAVPSAPQETVAAPPKTTPKSVAPAATASSYGRLFGTIRPGDLERERQVLNMHFINANASLARAEEFLQGDAKTRSLEDMQSHITTLYKELEIMAQLQIPAALPRDKDGVSLEEKRQSYFTRIAAVIDKFEALIFAQ